MKLLQFIPYELTLKRSTIKKQADFSEATLVRTLKLVWTITEGKLIWVLLMVLSENAFFLSSMYLFKKIITLASGSGVYTPEKKHLITTYILYAFLGVVLYTIIKGISSYLGKLQGARVGEYVDDKVHESAIKLDMAFYESPDYFDKLKRAKDAGSERPNQIVTGLVDLVKSVFMLFNLVYVVTSLSSLIVPILALFFFPVFFLRRAEVKRLEALRLIHTPLDRKTSYLGSLITGDVLAKEIRGFGLGEYLKGLYLEIRFRLIAQKLKIVRKAAINGVLLGILLITGIFTCIYLFILKVFSGKVSIGEIAIFFGVIPQLFSSVQSLNSGILKIYEDNIFLGHLFKLFDLQSGLVEPEEPLTISLNTSSILEVEDLSFSYPNVDLTVLSNINIRIPAGKVIAIVGLNGAGKTTLIKLLSRLYDPTSGCIRMNGIDIRNYKSTDYRKCISTVFQDFGKYHVSAADNIRFGDIDTVRPDSEYIDAATRAGASLYIDEFSEGYETIMGRIFDEGREISIGQWQKLAIARALYSPSRFIILDEATSALDAKSEKELFDNLKESIGNRGALFISHRLSAVLHADFIYVMAGGQIVQSGTHAELIEMEGDYADLFKKKVKRIKTD